jgi:mitochondrial fission protein ELM1
LPLTAWAITTGEAGMRTQARGLASAVAETVVEKIVALRAPQRWFQAGWPGLLAGLDPAGDRLDPPWPDLIVTCGRRSAIIGLAVKRAAKGRPALVHVQDPLAPLSGFDLVVAMAHDRVKGPKVVKTLTAMHDVTPARLGAAAGAWEPRFAHLHRPLTGLILGGPTRNSPFGLAEAQTLDRRVAAVRARTGGGLVVVGSRRTPPEVLGHFQEKASHDRAVWVWDGTGDNPYLGALALCDRLVVTGDSVSMVSEALATPHPVEVFAFNLRKRHSGFVQALADKGLVGFLDPDALAAKHPRLDATAEAAQAVREMLARRGRT